MEYISVRKAAEKWGVTMRQVQFYLKGNRIDGAVRPGRDWLIPADSKKPIPKRDHPPESSLSSDLANLIEATTIPMPHDDPYLILDTITEERERVHYECELAYLRGDFEQIKSIYKRTQGDKASRLRAGSIAIAAAISTGDYPFYLQIEDHLKHIIRTTEYDDVKAFAELSLSNAYLGALAPDMIPDWLKTGDFTLIHNRVKPDAVYKRAKYFQATNKPELMLTISETARCLSSLEEGLRFHDIYFHVLCAIACCALGRIKEARRWLSDAIAIALPSGFITPFAESATQFGGLLEQFLEQDYPDYYEKVLNQWKRTCKNWLVYHNRFTKDNCTLILSLREYQIAIMAARGASNSDIAGHFHISEGRLKAIMHEIYGKLFVKSRKELAAYIL